MNDRFFTNILKIAVSCALYYTGLLHLLIKLVVRRGLLIFNYHGFNTFISDYWRFGSLFTSDYGGNFEKQVRFYDRHFRKLSDIERPEASGRPPAYFLTFDDGYKDNFEIALPVLERYSVPSVFFIVTDCIGTDKLLWYDAVRLRYERKKPRGLLAASRLKRRCRKELKRIKERSHETANPWRMEIPLDKTPRLMMSWDEVRAVLAAGVVIGAHTNTHPMLSLLSRDAQWEEIRTSIEAIQEKTGRIPAFFSYPDGGVASYNNETVDILKGLGVRFVLTTEKGINGPSALPYSLKRIGVNPSDPVPVVALKIALVGLRSKLSLLRFAKWKDKVDLSFRQYGPWNALKRAFKTVLRRFGIRIETNYILLKNLEGPVDMPVPIEGLSVKRLTYEDFEASPFFSEFSLGKRDLLRQRFSSPDYQAFGAERDRELIYMAWIATDYLRIESIRFERKLDRGEGVLLDALTLPKARGLGIHNYMNMYRLARLREKGIKKAYVAVLAENRPALKTQVKSGFRQGEKILWLSVLRAGRLLKKDVYFSPAGKRESRG